MNQIAMQEKSLWYKEPFVWMFLTLLAIAVGASISLMWVAATTNDGLVTDDYYKKGLAIVEDFRRDDKARELGMNVQVMIGDDGQRVNATIVSGTDHPATMTLKFAHPTQSGLDQTVTLTQDGTGMYTGQLQGHLHRQRWLLDLEAPAGWRLYDQHKLSAGAVIMLRPQEHNKAADQ